jgi:hypothetical protein
MPEARRPERQHVFVQRGKSEVIHPEDSLQAHTKQTAHFRVSYASTLGNDGITIADAILARCEQDYTTLQGYFGGITPGSIPFHIRVTTGNTGASHATCQATGLSIGARSAPGVDTAFMRQLVIAEADEVFMANFGHGWDCGASNGEGLSRVLANDMVPGAEPPGFVSASVWLDPPTDGTPSRPDFVNNTDPIDTNYHSIGCSVLFLNWLRFQLGHSWKDVIAAGGPTLAQTYANLTGLTDGFARFKALIQQHYPEGSISGVTKDNPFPLP